MPLSEGDAEKKSERKEYRSLAKYQWYHHILSLRFVRYELPPKKKRRGISKQITTSMYHQEQDRTGHKSKDLLNFAASRREKKKTRPRWVWALAALIVILPLPAPHPLVPSPFPDTGLVMRGHVLDILHHRFDS